MYYKDKLLTDKRVEVTNFEFTLWVIAELIVIGIAVMLIRAVILM